MASTFVVTWTWWAQSLFEGLALALAWKMIAVGVCGAIFWRQIVPVRGRDAAVAVDIVPAGVPAHVVPLVTGVAAAFGTGGYRRWTATHPAAAQAAERWLTAMVGEGTAAIPAIALPTSVPIDARWSRGRRLRAPQIHQLRTSALAARSGSARGSVPAHVDDLPVRNRTGARTPFPPPGPAMFRSSSEQDPLRVDQVLP